MRGKRNVKGTMRIRKMYKVKKEKERRVNGTDEERDREKGCKSE